MSSSNQYIATLLMALLAVTIGSMDMHMPAMPLMREAFHTTEATLQMTIALYNFVGALIGIPIGHMADRFGRRRLILIGCFIFCCGSIFCSIASSIEIFMLARVIQSIGMAYIGVLSTVILSDLYKGVQFARWMSVYAIMFPFMFAVAPLIGAIFLNYFGWRFIFIFLTICTMIFFCALYRVLPETLKKQGDHHPSMWREMKFLLMHSHFMSLCFLVGLPVTLTTIYIACSAFIFIDIFKFSPTGYALTNTMTTLCNIIGALLYRRLITKIGLYHALKIGITFIGLFIVLCPIVLITGLYNNVWILICLVCVYGFAMPYCIITANSASMALLKENKGLAISYLNLARNICMAIGVTVGSYIYNKTPVPTFILLLFVAILIFILGLYILKNVLNPKDLREAEPQTEEALGL